MYIEIQKGMYGLPQAGMLANKILKHRLTKHGYYEVRHTLGYWRHTWRPIDFMLIVDDFGVGYENNDHAILIQFPPEMDENWVRYGLAKFGTNF